MRLDVDVLDWLFCQNVLLLAVYDRGELTGGLRLVFHFRDEKELSCCGYVGGFSCVHISTASSFNGKLKGEL